MERISIQEIAAVLTIKCGLTKKDAERFATTMFEVVKEGLESERLVKIKGLGTFKVIDIEARESVNVNTGERVLIEGHGKVTFTPDATMKELVNKPFSQFETVVLNEGVVFDDDVAETAVDAAAEDDASEEETVETAVAEPEPEPVVQEEPEPELVVQEEPEPVAQEEPEPVAQEEPEPVVQEEPEPVIQEEPEPEPESVVQEEPEPVTQEEESETPPILEFFDDEATATEEDTPEEIEEEPLEAEPSIDAAEEEIIEENEETPMRHRQNVKRLLLTCGLAGLLACIAAFALGYYLGYNKGVKNAGFPVIEEIVEDSASTAKPGNVVKNKSGVDAPAQKVAPAEPVAAVESPVAESGKQAAKPEEAPKAKQETTPASPDKYEQMDARVRTGAYRIVGTDYEVTAREGESTARVAKRTLGPGMECYVEVYNGLTGSSVLKDGQTVKIPKLEVKKKKKKQN